jgi:hypothetical protein
MKVSLCKGRFRGIFNPVQNDFDETLQLSLLKLLDETFAHDLIHE